MPWIRRILLVMLPVGAAAVLLAAWPGGEKELARGPGEVLRMEARPEGLFWLEAARAARSPAEAPAARRLLFLAHGATAPDTLIEAPHLDDFAVHDALYCLTADSLLRVPLQGGEPELLRSGLRNPAALFVGEEWISWTETSPAAPVAVPVLPLTRPLTSLRALRRSAAAPVTLTVIDGDADAAARVLGEADGALYWIEHRLGGRPATLVKAGRVSGDGGRAMAVETLATEEGTHEGLMAGGMVYWMGQSREGSPVRAFASANRRTRDGRVELLGDWMSPEGTLRADGERVYYCRRGVFALPGDAGVARRLVGLEAPGRLTALARGNAYAAMNEAGQGYRIVRRRIGWGML